MIDGYAGYHKLEPEVKLSCCWAHYPSRKIIRERMLQMALLQYSA